MTWSASRIVLLCLIVAVSSSSCRKRAQTGPVPQTPAPAAFPSANPAPPSPGAPPSAAPTVASGDPVASTPLLPWDNQPLDVINGPDSPLKPVFYLYDSDQLDAEGKKALEANAALLKQYPRWVITIEGHCDERGSAEYNLALGDRRALAAKTYLVSLGISPDRIRTVSYGNEFPFEPGHNEAAWSKNRRAHFMLTSK
jgi:peptidoglycan-associated lipoprotein